MTAEQILHQAVVHTQQMETNATARSYTYTRVCVTEEMDLSGKVREHKEKTYQVWFQDGLTHAKLLSVNGHVPENADLKKQADNEMSVRQLTGAPKSNGGDNRENFLTPELVARFDFTLRGQAVLNGRTAYKVTFEPKRPAPAEHRLVDRLLNRLSGTLWLDTEEFEVARAEVHLQSEVDLLGGLIGSLKKLTYTMTRTRVAEGLWLSEFSSGDFEGRKLLASMRIKTQSQSRNFRPLALNSATGRRNS